MPAGRPTDYRPEFCDQVLEYGREGKSHAQIAARLDVARKTLYEWQERYPEFGDAMAYARDLAQNWFEDRGQEGLAMGSGFNASLWAKQVSCRFREDYTDKSEVKQDVRVTGIERVIVRPKS